ncbi:HAD-IB family hydrolase [Caballeronia sp. LP006]|uniref:HAD-IB family hydrolase n=1 Tax=Caballeronia sp. LP006 TaxID=3038552 RepID=UPI00285446CE|nr:HAD-IB family hydrolase [Caballeronia sp. LP006]MDR5827359.1 HAD-IB family hydrolase [Caballeronia sp. LP006]
MSKQHRTVAAFDFDGTITTGDSLKAFVLHTVGPIRFATSAIWAAPALTGMALGRCDRGTAKAEYLKYALKHVSRDALQLAAQSFCATRLPAMIRPEMIERVRQHQALGHEVVIVSASPSLYLRLWAQTIGIGTVLSTELELTESGYAGRFIGANCWGPEKVERLKAWWGAYRPMTLYAYGDSAGDKEMAEAADVPWIRGCGALPTLPALSDTHY